MSSKSIGIILSYTVSKFALFEIQCSSLFSVEIPLSLEKTISAQYIFPTFNSYKSHRRMEVNAVYD